MMRKLHKKKYHMEGSFNIDLFKQLVQEAFAITYDDFSIQQCDDSTHEHFDLVNKKLSNQEKTKIFPDTKKYTLLNQAIEVFISVVAGGTP